MLIKKMLKETNNYEKRLIQGAYSSFLYAKNSILAFMSGILMLTGGQCKENIIPVVDESPQSYDYVDKVLERAYQMVKFIDQQEYESMVYNHDSTFGEKERNALENIKKQFKQLYENKYKKDLSESFSFLKESLCYEVDADKSADGLYHSELEQKRLSIVQIDSNKDGGIAVNLLMERNKISKAFVDLYYVNDEFGAMINPFYDHAYKYNGFITFVICGEEVFQVLYTFKDEQMSIQKVDVFDQNTLNKEIRYKNTNYQYETDFVQSK